MHFKAVEREGRVEGALLIVSDITRQVQARRIELMQREQLKVFERVLNDRIGFLVFFQEARAIVERIFENAFPGNDECLRAVHTLKGNCAIFDVTTVAPIAHRLEQAIVDDESELRDKELQNLGAAWDQFARNVATLLGDDPGDRIELTQAELDAVIAAVRERAS